MFGVVTLTLAEANSIVDAAIAKARQLNVSVSVTVCDQRGRLIALNRMDGASAEANRFSIGKAIASAGTGLPSGEVKGIIDSQAEIVGEGAPPIGTQGGLPIFQNNLIEGACGVDGARSHEQEEECARAGIASISRQPCRKGARLA
jgi:glc operon protein GlcG